MSMPNAVALPSSVTIKSQQAVGDLPEADMVREFLKQGGLENTENYESEGGTDGIVWNFVALPSEAGLEGAFSVIINLYRVKDNPEVFIWVEIAICKLPQQKSSFYEWALKKNYDFHFPVRLSVSPQGFLVAQFRTYVGGVTEDGLKTRLSSIVPIATAVMEEARDMFGLKALILLQEQ